MPPYRFIRFVKTAAPHEWGIPLPQLIGLEWVRGPGLPAPAAAPVAVVPRDELTLHFSAGSVTVTGDDLRKLYVRLVTGETDNADAAEKKESCFITIKENARLKIGELK